MSRLTIETCLCFLLAAAFCHAQEFDITSLSSAGREAIAAEGTSNGIGWTMSETLGGVVPVTDGSYSGFSDAAFFSPAIPATDMIYIGSSRYTLTFAQEVQSALFYLRANGTFASGIDFGITPVLVSGEVSIVGTVADPSTNGGIVRLDGINSISLTHTPFSNNGVRLAWIVTAVPEPSSAALLCVATLAIFRFSLRRRQR